MQITEHRMRPQSLADLLLYDALIDDGILLQQDGSLLAAWSFQGPDLSSATHGEMAVLSARLNSILRLGSGWMIQCDAIRTRAPGYPDSGAFPDAITRLIDDERREQFLREGTHFESQYILTLTYLPPSETEQNLRGWLFEGQTTRPSAADQAFTHFKARIAHFDEILGSLFQIKRLRSEPTEGILGEYIRHDNLLRYIRRTIIGEDYPFTLPLIPTYLNDILSVHDFVAGIEPRIGRKHIRLVAIDGFPNTSSPGILSVLDSLPIEYRWNTRAILMDPEEARAYLDKTRKKWRSRVRGWKDQIFRTQNGAINLHAQEMAIDAEEAMGVASSGDINFAFYTSVVVCLHEDEQVVNEAAALVAKTIQNQGFSPRIETVNAVEAWRGTLPGDGYRNVRRVVLHTLNLSDLLPITSVWAGLPVNPSALMPQGSPPLLYAATTGATPFRFNLHVSDVGHTIIIGPSGAGKSTLLGLIASQWFRYPDAQVFAFDKGYSLHVLNRASGGEFYDIGGERTQLAFCPLREIDTDQDLAWSVNWLEGLCVAQGMNVGPKHRQAITEAVQRLRLSPARTLTEFCAEVQEEEIRGALQYYTLSGPLGQLLDAERDMLGAGRFVTFETENLVQLGDKAVVAVLLYLFRRIEKRLNGSPTLVPLDEAWVYLRHPLFRERLRDWLKTLRKMNGVVILATQNLSDVLNSEIGDVIVETCPTKVLLPNAEAANPAARRFYDRMGLNDREIEILQGSIPKRHYYVVSPLGRRLISLGLGGVALSFVGVNGKQEREIAENLLDQYGPQWQAEWLRRRGLAEWADYLEPMLPNSERRMMCVGA